MNRTERKVAFARQNTVAVGGQLARRADQVARLDPREVDRAFRCARSSVLLGPVKKWNTSRQTPALEAPDCSIERDRRFQAGTERRRLLKLESQPHAEGRRQLGGFTERGGGAKVIVGDSAAPRNPA